MTRRRPVQLPLALVAPCFRVVELCAGSAAFTLRVLDADGRPPISYPGAKTGYCDALLLLVGLMPGQGAREILWCEPGPWAQVWATLADPELRAQVVARLRSWQGEPPRALWDVLRAELKQHPISGEEVAGWLFVKGNAVKGDCFKAQSAARQAAGAMLGLSARTIADRIARYMLALPADHLSIYNGSAMDLEPGDETGTVTLLDPPYLGDGTRKVTGYAHTLTRAEVVTLALRWHGAGARVLVCESVAIPELVALGWTAHDIAGARRGQIRSWSKEQGEIVTVSPWPSPAVSPAAHRSPAGAGRELQHPDAPERLPRGVGLTPGAGPRVVPEPARRARLDCGAVHAAPVVHVEGAAA